MDIPVSSLFGFIRVLFKPIVDYLDKLFFYEAYKISTQYQFHRDVFGVSPDELVNGIKYKILWEPYYLGKRLVTPMIWLKAEENEYFSKVVLTVTASNSKIKYQDSITLYNLDEIPIQTALPSIPFRILNIKGGIAFTPYDFIETKVDELHDKQSKKIELLSEKKYFHPFDRLAVHMGLEKGYVEKWGNIFNLRFIEQQFKEEELKYIYGGFLLSPSFKKKILKKQLFRAHWIVKSIFWIKNIIFAKQLKTELAKYLKEQIEYEKRKDES